MKSHSLKVSLSLIVLVATISSGAFAAPTQPTPPSSYAELIAKPDADLAKLDIALMNLLCAEDLPGADNIDLIDCLTLLDQWAELVRQAERKYLPQFHRNPGRYDHSLAKFKAVNLALTLKLDLGCHYNRELVTSGAMENIRSTQFFRNSSDLFLHGLITNQKGSCASLPVLMVAIGRRCGYPLYLSTSKGHLFCRWEDDSERFNIETATEGVDSKLDAYYLHWPHPLDHGELATEKYLKSLSPAEELGIFTQIRAACLEENQRFKEAAQAYQTALRSFPNSKYIKAYLENLKGKN